MRASLLYTQQKQRPPPPPPRPILVKSLNWLVEAFPAAQCSQYRPLLKEKLQHQCHPHPLDACHFPVPPPHSLLNSWGWGGGVIYQPVVFNFLGYTLFQPHLGNVRTALTVTTRGDRITEPQTSKITCTFQKPLCLPLTRGLCTLSVTQQEFPPFSPAYQQHCGWVSSACLSGFTL